MQFNSSNSTINVGDRVILTDKLINNKLVGCIGRVHYIHKSSYLSYDELYLIDLSESIDRLSNRDIDLHLHRGLMWVDCIENALPNNTGIWTTINCLRLVDTNSNRKFKLRA